MLTADISYCLAKRCGAGWGSLSADRRNGPTS